MNIRISRLLLGTALIAFGCGDKGGDSAADTDSTETTGTTTGGTATGTAGTDVTGTPECGTVHEVTTTDDASDMDLYMDFTPENLTIAAGDCVNFVMSADHNAVEVSQENYDNRIGTALEGGFEVEYGTTAEVYFGEAGVHYFVCQPHVRADMVGTITVE